jgi:hypothetical protein
MERLFLKQELMEGDGEVLWRPNRKVERSELDGRGHVQRNRLRSHGYRRTAVRQCRQHRSRRLPVDANATRRRRPNRCRRLRAAGMRRRCRARSPRANPRRIRQQKGDAEDGPNDPGCAEKLHFATPTLMHEGCQNITDAESAKRVPSLLRENPQAEGPDS